MRRRDDGEIAPKGNLNLSVEMVFMIVGKQDYIYGRKIMQVDEGIRLARACDARAKMDMVASMQEVGICHETEAVPFQDCCGSTDEQQARISAVLWGCLGVGLGGFGIWKLRLRCFGFWLITSGRLLGVGVNLECVHHDYVHDILYWHARCIGLKLSTAKDAS